MNRADRVDILVLGAGWTSQFLVPLLEQHKISYALTTTSGKVNKFCKGKYDDTHIRRFAFVPDPESDSEEAKKFDFKSDEKQYADLPEAKTVLITFKLEGQHESEKLVKIYGRTHSGPSLSNFIQLGSTGLWKQNGEHNRESPYDQNSRGEAEDKLRELEGCVLNLAGLWGAERIPKNWVAKVANTKEKLRSKQSLHLIHGEDVSRACIAVHQQFYPGERYILTDQKVYDWWQLIDWWADDLEAEGTQTGDEKPEYRRWLSEVKREADVRSLPRDREQLGRALDSSDFWRIYHIQPKHILTKPGRSKH